MTLLLKVILQVLAVAIAMLVGMLDYVLNDKSQIWYKRGRILLFILSTLFLAASVIVTIVENKESSDRENKLTEQNTKLLKSVELLSVDQRKKFNDILTDQKTVGDETAERIDKATFNLGHRIDSSINLLNNSNYEIARAANPIRNLTVDFELLIEAKHFYCLPYYDKLLAKIKSLIVKPNEDIGEISPASNGFRRLYVNNASLAPDKKVDEVAHNSLSIGYIKFHIYKDDISDEKLISGNIQPDIEFIVVGTQDQSMSRVFNHDNNMSILSLSYLFVEEPKDGFFSVHATGLVPFSQRSTGAIISVLDLPSKKILIRIRDRSFSLGRGNISLEVEKLRRNFDLRGVILKMSEGREIRLDGRIFRSYYDKDNEVVFIGEIPRFK